MSATSTLTTRVIGDIEEPFWVPSYQRGYRWGSHEVTQLLDDLEANLGSSYYLQPVVVRARGEQWELIDGQQRMTTLYLLLRHMERAGLQSMGPGFSLAYETRPGSAAYLDDPVDGPHTSNIDFWHIHQADRAIAAWFERQGNRKQVVANDIYGALFKSVKIIWYVVPDHLDEVEMFTRLNVGRIPLTNAELIKAQILASSGERSHEVAAEWDTIERTLRDPDLWAFASGRSDEQATHITLVLDAVAIMSCAACADGSHGASDRDRPVFHTFEVLSGRTGAEGWKAVWDEVVDLYSLILGWFEDREVFHLVGYLVAIRVPIRDIVSKAVGLPKSAFLDLLRGEIRHRLSLTEDDLGSLDYEADSAICERVLLLMNVELVKRRSSTLERFPFAEHARHAWSLEHIHAQNAQALTKAEQWQTWLTAQAKALAVLPHATGDAISDLLSEIEDAIPTVTEHVFDDLSERVLAVFEQWSASDGSAIHGISNLALLGRDMNSALSNSVFEVKRAHIIEADQRGDYIPPATRNVFLKYYTGADAQQVHFWSAQDREAYVSAIVDSVGGYLLDKGADA